MDNRLAALLTVAALVPAALACAEPSRPSAEQKEASARQSPPAADARRLAPVPAAEAASAHGPYQMGACDTCHQRNDPKNPGPALKVSNDLCCDCHDDFREAAAVKMDGSIHPAATAACITCHNPHNSRKKKLRL